VNHPTQEDAAHKRHTGEEKASRHDVDIAPHHPACTIENRVACVFAAIQEEPTTVPWNVHDGMESTLAVEIPIDTLTEWLCATFTTCAHLVYLIFFQVHPVWTKLWGERYLLVREPFVPRRRDLRGTVVLRSLITVLFPSSTHNGSRRSTLTWWYQRCAASDHWRGDLIGWETTCGQHHSSG